MRIRAGSQIGGVLAAVMVCTLPTTLIAQGAPVSGLNVNRVEIMGENGVEVFTPTPSGEWVQLGARGEVRFRFDEAGRDATSVYLYDRSRDFRIQLDVSDRTLSFRAPDGRKAVFATMMAFSVGPATVAVASRPAATPTSAPTATPAVPAFTPAPADAALEDDLDFDPFADPAAKGGAAGGPTGGATVVGAARSPNAPPFVNAGGNASVRSAAAAPVAAGGQFDGPWIESNKPPEQRGDGVTGPVTWILPEAILIRSAGDVLSIHFDANPSGSITLNKTGENAFSGGGHQASFEPIDGGYRLTLTGGGRSRAFDMARTSEGLLSRQRFDPEARAETDNRRGLFNQAGLVRGWNAMFHSYRGEDMDLFNPARGRAVMIFKQPGARDHATDDNISKSLPYGVRGYPTNLTDAQQLETVISNANSFQKSMSYNFGGGGGTEKASLGVNVSRETAAGTENSSGNTKAMGLARAETFVLVLDKPNIELASGFRSDILRLAGGQMTAAAFRQAYGTHYAAAIHYGGIGKAERVVTTRELKDFVSESTTVSAEGAFKGVKMNGGFTAASGSTAGASSMFSKTAWRASGGSGSMSEGGWTVGEENSMPIRYDLRPLSDLVSPLYFAEEWDSPRRGALIGARQQLAAEIERHLASQPGLDDRLTTPIIYGLTFHSLVCMNNGDEGRADAWLFGKINAQVRGLDGTETLILFEGLEGGLKKVVCDGRSEHPIEKTVYVADSRTAGTAYFSILTEGLHEDDNSFTDPDDPLMVFPPAPVRLSEWRADQPRSDIAGTQITNPPGVRFGPDLRLRVSFKPLQ